MLFSIHHLFVNQAGVGNDLGNVFKSLSVEGDQGKKHLGDEFLKGYEELKSVLAGLILSVDGQGNNIQKHSMMAAFAKMLTSFLDVLVKLFAEMALTKTMVG